MIIAMGSVAGANNFCPDLSVNSVWFRAPPPNHGNDHPFGRVAFVPLDDFAVKKHSPGLIGRSVRNKVELCPVLSLSSAIVWVCS